MRGSRQAFARTGACHNRSGRCHSLICAFAVGLGKWTSRITRYTVNAQRLSQTAESYNEAKIRHSTR